MKSDGPFSIRLIHTVAADPLRGLLKLGVRRINHQRKKGVITTALSKKYGGLDDDGGAAAIRRIIRAHTGGILTSTCGDIAP